MTSRLKSLPFDERAASHAADITAVSRRRGQMIGADDALIAVHARSQGLKIITTNHGEFMRMEGLICEDWLLAPYTNRRGA